MSNYLAFCEIYTAKPSLYFDDNDYYLDKVGGFVARDFDISLGNLGGKTSGSLRVPQNLELFGSFKIGDIVNITLVNFGFQSIQKVYHFPEIDSFSSLTDNRNQLQQAYVITAFDGDRLILTDYNEFNLSYVTVGYVGGVTKGRVNRVINSITRKDMRAFACRLYTYEGFKIPFRTNINFSEYLTSFSDDFEKTNVKPWDVFKKTISGIKGIKEQAIKVGAVVKKENGRYYVFSYIVNLSSGNLFENRTLRFKPTFNYNVTPKNNNMAATVWIQSKDSGDDYIRAGVVVANNSGSGVVFKTLGKLRESDFNNIGLTELSTILISYKQLFENKVFDNYLPKKFDEVAPDKTLYGSDSEYKSDKKAWDDAKKDATEASKSVEESIKKFNTDMMNTLGVKLDSVIVKELLYNAINGVSGNYPPIENPFNSNVDWENIIHENIRNIIKGALKAQYTPITIDCGENDFYSSDLDFDGDERLKIYLSNRFGASINGDIAYVTTVNYSNNGRKYTIETVGD